MNNNIFFSVRFTRFSMKLVSAIHKSNRLTIVLLSSHYSQTELQL